ncbi:MAG: putative integral rane protein [Thermoleophilia bacterium]|nr:putative integral rane protein [Thermoleophilia bacterium]
MHAQASTSTAATQAPDGIVVRPRGVVGGDDGPHEWRPTRRRRRWLRRLVAVALLLLLVVVFAPRATTWMLARGDIAHRPADLPRLAAGHHRAAIVLGAGLQGERPSPLLADRISAAVRLLGEDRADLLLMSGDNSTEFYDEPTAMRTAAIEAGVAPEQVAPDYAGRRTWDTCVRARRVFGIRDAVIVTSAFHVDRAVASCRAAGIHVTGYSVSDDRFSVKHRAVWRTRELAATGRGLLDAWVLRPEPAVGGDRIDPYDPCELFASLAPSVAAESADDFGALGCG